MLRTPPLIFLCLAIVSAPLAYGCTTPATIAGLDVLLLLMAGSWLIQKLKAADGLAVAWFPVGLTGLLGLIAVGQVLNPVAVWDPKTLNLARLASGLPFLPQTVDRATSLALLPHLLILGASFPVVMDLAHSRRNRWTILRAVTVSGSVVALVGIGQKAAGGDPLLWGNLRPNETTFFAAFRYHGNAAAFLNLCWPAALALFLRSCQEQKHVGRNLWGLAWLFIFGALFVNTSKFGHAAALPLLVGAGIAFSRHLPADWFRPSLRNLLVLFVVLLVMGALSVPTLGVTLAKWQTHLEGGITLQLRQLTYSICLAMVRDASLFGFGTGSFPLLFPYYAVPLGDLVVGRWSYAHQDYLQAAIEWGWIGAALWTALFLPPVFRQLGRSLGPRADLTGSAALIGFAGTLAHGMIDFPFQIASIHFVCLLFLAFLWRPHQHGGKAGEGDRRSAHQLAPSCR